MPMTGDIQQAKASGMYSRFSMLPLETPSARAEMTKAPPAFHGIKGDTSVPPSSTARDRLNVEYPMPRYTGAYMRPGSAMDRSGSQATRLVARSEDARAGKGWGGTCRS